jgi:putative transposon-encoded protein
VPAGLRDRRTCDSSKGRNDRVRKEAKEKVTSAPLEVAKGRVKFEVYGEEMLEKKVSLSGNSGRIYLPPDWVGHHVKIIRID